MRYLVAVSDMRVANAGPGIEVGVDSGPFRILEGATGILPLKMQGEYVSQETAENVARKYPQIYRIRHRGN